MGTRCAADGCDKDAKAGGWCWGHYKQLQRGKTLAPLQGTVVEVRFRMLEAAIDLADADSENDQAFRNARQRFWRTFRVCASVELDRLNLSKPAETPRQQRGTSDSDRGTDSA